MKAIYIAQVGVWRDGEKFVFDRKFFDGMQLYVDLWAGDIHCIAWESNQPRPAFGTVSRGSFDLGFALTLLKPDEPLTQVSFSGAKIIVGGADDYRQLDLPKLAGHIPSLMDIEYTPTTRRDIINAEIGNPIRRLVRQHRIRKMEKKRAETLRNVSGVSANGIAAYNLYGLNAKAAMLYFDTRATRAMQISGLDIGNKHEGMLEGKPLRLVFSGRLIKMKGVDALLKVADLLMKRGTPFTLDVYGAGEMEREVVYASRNSSAILWRGAVDFETVLMPSLKTDYDLFVCCHRQGDPSCTYLETFSAGVPMVGFANESLAPLSIMSKAASTVPMNDVKALADLITKLHFDRQKLVAMSQAAADFSRTHTFEDEFKRRVDFWKQLARA